MAKTTRSWVKSSYSGSQAGNCVEAASTGPDQILVRDTQDRAGAVLAFRAAHWNRFASALKMRKTGER
jgi:hypothetical protein